MTVISIALASYNGEKYIAEQLESLRLQSHLPAELVVGDDGSTDETLAIIEEFATRAPFPVHVRQNKRNLGYARNFLEVANRCRGEWIAFCDQDDVWLPNKLAEAARAIESTPDCSMVLQNAMLCDANLIPSDRLFPDKLSPGVYGPNEIYGFWVWPGFLKTVRSDWLQELDSVHRPLNFFPDHKLQSHDKWTCMVANALGGIRVLGERAAFYRRHESALTGSYAGKSLRARVEESLGVEADQYRFLADVARSSRAYLDRVAEEVNNDQWRSLFRQSGMCFERLAEIQDHRSTLYEGEDVLTRAACYLRIWRSGGYVVGRCFTAMGVKSAWKDAARFFAGSRVTKKNGP